MRIRWSKAPIADVLSSHLVDYPSPTNMGYLWGIGSTAGLCLGVQIVTGIFLAMHYLQIFNDNLDTKRDHFMDFESVAYGHSFMDMDLAEQIFDMDKGPEVAYHLPEQLLVLSHACLAPWLLFIDVTPGAAGCAC